MKGKRVVLALAALGVGGVVGCSTVTDWVSDDEIECYTTVTQLEERIEELEAALERAELRLAAQKGDEYPQFLAAFESYLVADHRAAIDGFTRFIADYPDSEFGDLADKLRARSRLDLARLELFCGEELRILKEKLPLETPAGREANAAALLRECPHLQSDLRAILQGYAREDALREQFSVPRSGGEAETPPDG